MIIDTRKNLSDKNPLLQDGEIAYEIDKDLFKIGDGKQNYNSIGYDTPDIDFINIVHFLFESKIQARNGERGERGVRGEKGNDGKRGEQGVKGEQGIEGKKGEKGDIVVKGERGDRGFEGEKGEKGDRGFDGKPGEKGEDGFDGSFWLSGRGEPNSYLGKDTDFYLNLFNKNYYQKLSGEWMLLGSLDSTCKSCLTYGSSAVSYAKEVEIDFGTDSFQTYNIFNIVDTSILETSKIILSKSIKSPSDGRSVDEIFAETLDISAKANNGNFDLYIKSIVGTITGKYIINYTK